MTGFEPRRRCRVWHMAGPKIPARVSHARRHGSLGRIAFITPSATQPSMVPRAPTVLLAAAAAFALGMAGAELALADPPLKQWRSGVPASDIACATGTVLVESPGGRPACVAKGTSAALAGRGWSMVQPEYSRATIIKGMMPVLEEIRYPSRYDVEFPPYAYRPQAEDVGRTLSNMVPPEEAFRDYRDSPGWLDISSKPVITNIGKGLGPDDETFWPQYVMEADHTAQLFSPFKLAYDYSYAVPG